MIAENAYCRLSGHIHNPGGRVSRGRCQKGIVIGKAHINYSVSVYREGEIGILECWFPIPARLEEPYSTFFISNCSKGICF
jgi:hypothetical protein